LFLTFTLQAQTTGPVAVSAPGTFSGNTSTGTNNCPLSASNDAQYIVTIPEFGDWTFATCGSSFDSFIYIGSTACSQDIGSADDGCGVQSSFTATSLCPGTYHVTIEGFGAFDQGSYFFSVSAANLGDPPTYFGCPSNQTLNVVTGCDTTVSWTAPVAISNCGDHTVQTTHNPGDTFSVGTTTVTYMAISGSTADTTFCTFDVTVTDSSIPTITCPADLTQNNDAGLAGATVTYSAPTASANCATPTISLISGVGSGNFFPIGTTTDVHVVDDGAGNTDTCEVEVTVLDVEPPTLNCPTDFTQSVDATTCGATVTYTAVTASDNAPGASVVFTSGVGSGGTFPVGTTTELYTASDASANTATCSFTVTVVDDEDPTLSACPGNITTVNDAGLCTAAVTWTDPTASDNCPGVGLAGTHTSGDNFNVGTTTVTFTATDAASNTATCSFDVTVNDNELPTISCPSDITMPNDAGNCTAVVTYTAPTGADNCPGQTTSLTSGSGSGAAFPVGTSTEVYTVTDGASNTATCSFDITINDTEAPTITCPANITQNNDAGNCDAVVTYTAPTGTDNCPAPTTALSNGLGSGSAFPVGTNTEVYTVTDASGTTASCSFDIVVNDTENPFISCPSDITQNSDAGGCNAVVTYSTPAGTDNCPSPTTVLTTGFASNNAFPVGTTTVTYEVTDVGGNTATCSFDVTINDTEAPNVICPPDVTQANDAGNCDAAVTTGFPIVTDNCSATASNDFNSTSNASDTYPVGTTTVTFTATDAASNTGTCSFTVTINDTEAPAITCPADITQANDAGNCDAAVNVGIPNSADNCPTVTNINDFNSTTDATDTYPVGTTTVTFTATDGNSNTATCSFDITVTDSEVPTITCPTDITQASTGGTCDEAVTVPAPTVGDNCPGVSATNDFNSTTDASDTYPAGTTTVTFTATDAATNTATCSFDVTVTDGTDPTITCPASITQDNDAGNCDAAVTVAAPTVSDNCPGETFSNDFNSTTDASDTYPVGTTTVTFTVTDAALNTATCSFDVTINDTENPDITCPGDITQDTDAGVCDAAVNVGTPNFIDNCPGSSISNDFNSTSDASDTYPLGTTTVTFTVTDGAANTNTCSFDVTINDNEDPIIACPATMTVASDPGTCSAAVTVSAPTVTDNCVGTTIVNDFNNTSDASDTYTGTTTVTFTATDAASNTATCSFDVVIDDTEAPTITCPASTTQANDAGNCDAAVTIAVPTTTDNCPGETASNDFNATSDASDTYPVGTTTVTFTVTDGNSNTATCSFDVTINDTELPTISCPADFTQSVDAGLTTATVTVPAPTAADNCPGTTLTNSFNATSDASGTYNVGTTTVTFTITDAASNSASCSLDITIEDDQPPTITCPTDITQNNDAGNCDAAVTVPTPVFSDNAPGATISNDFNNTSDGSDTYPVGTTTVTFTVTDAASNTATCSLDVTINDTEAPTITCPTDITQSNDAGNCDAAVTVPAPTVGDNCPSPTLTNDFNATSDASDTYNVATTTVTFTVTDAGGLTATCSFDVTVEDTELPTITCPADMTVDTDPGNCDAAVTVPAPTVGDNCPTTTLTNNFNGTSDASGTYPGGNNTVAFTVTDASSNSASCSFVVRVNDIEAPTITCPGDITQNNDAGVCDAAVTVPAPTTADNCPVLNVSNDFNATSDASDTYPVGTTTVTFTVSDLGSNTATCSFDVTINDTEAPTISCPSDITQNNDASTCGAAITVPAPTVTDNCPSPTLVNDFNNTSDASDTYPGGVVTTVVYTVTDAGGATATCSFDITVNDTEAPTITCPANITQSNDGGSCNAAVTVPLPTTTDNCASSLVVSNNFNGTSDASGTYPGGNNTVTFAVSDGEGNTASCSFTVRIEDTENPSITCPVNISEPTDAGVCEAAVTVPAPTALDNCPVLNITNDFTGTSDASGTYPAGTTTVTYTVSDLGGNTATCSFDVLVSDNELPTIACPNDMTQGTDAGICAAAVTVPAPTTSDNCPTSVVLANSFNGTSDASDTYALGSTTVTFTATDGGGNVATCSFDITINDTDPPVIVCPADVTQDNDAGNCDAAVTIAAPTLSENCIGAGAANDFNGTSDASDTYPVGATTVTFTATDTAGNTSSCSFMVTINDTELPTITCPADITQTTAAGQCDAAVTVAAPTTADNCPGSTLTNNFNGTSDASGTYPGGTNTVAFTVTDASSNSASCSFTVTITDAEVPTITCPSDITQNNDAGGCDAAVTVPAPTTADNCPVLNVSNDFNATSDASDTYPVGTTTVTFTVSDLGSNTATCSFDVTVNDTEAPTITCPTGITQDNDAGNCDAAVTIGAATTTDNCPSPTVTNDFNATSDASDTYPVGSTTVVFTVTDAGGNTATCSLDVTINDTEAPSIVCPADITQASDAGACDAAVTVPAPTGGDNCPGATFVNDFNNTVDPSDTYPVGTTTVTFTATDAASNTGSCSFDITVTDSEIPTITCPTDITQNNDAASCDAAVTVAAPTAADNCPGVTVSNDFNNTSDASDTYPVGTTTVVFTATDAASNTASCSFDITIEDTEDPTITCPTDITQSIDAGVCTATVAVPAPAAADNCPSFTLVNDFNNTSDASDTYPLGTTTVGFLVTDAGGNTASCDFTVTVVDTVAPSITCPSNISQGNDAASCDAALTIAVPTFTTNCTGGAITNDFNNTSDASDTYPVGTTTVTYTVTDGGSNSATCSFDVTITDTELPTVTCPAGITQDADAGTCAAALTIAAVSASDNCPSPSITNDFNGTSDASGMYSLGTTTVTFTVTDASNNTATCSFDVTIEDNEAPSFASCPTDMTVGLDPGMCDATVTWTEPTASDNCSSVNVASTHTSGSTFVSGTVTVTYTATDSIGNTAECTFDVTVQDTEVPQIICPSDVTVNTDAGVCDAAVTVSQALFVDNCPGASVTNNFNNTSNASDTYALGTTTVIFMVTDAVSNTATCSMTVTVEDGEAPVVSCPADITQSNDAGNCDAAVTIAAVTATDNCSATTATNDFNNTSDASDTYPLGTTTVVFTVSDVASNTATCSMTVTIEDTEAPTLASCPTDMTVATDVGLCTATVTWTDPTPNDNCPGATLSGSHTSGDTFVGGTTTVTFTATDAASNTATCSFDVTVQDSEAPQVICPNDVTQNTDPGVCDAAVTVDPALILDNCPGSSVTNDFNNTADASDTYPLGTTTVVFTVTDAASNTATCSMTVTILDAVPPTITCAADMTQSNDAGNCDAAVTVPVPTFTTNCAFGSLVNDFNGGSDATGTYPVGTTTVTWTVTDGSSNTATCSTDITVEDTENPVVVCSADISQNVDAGGCDAIVSIPQPALADNCPGFNASNDFNGLIDASGTYPAGITTVTWTITDAAGNTMTCDVVVTITDPTPPTFSGCPTDITMSTDANVCSAVVTWTPPVDNDNCTGAVVTNTHNSGDSFPVGTTSVLYTVTDVSNNTATCGFDVTINDTEIPQILCPSDVTVDAAANSCDAAATVGAVLALDNCPGISITNDFNATSDASGTYPLGTTTVTFMVTDASSNTATCSMTVTVQDVTAPTITCPPSLTQANDAASCDAAVAIQAPLASDNCPGGSFVNDFNNTSDASDTYPVGTTTVTFTATDAANNTATCSLDVTVEDQEAPTVVNCPTDITAGVSPGLCTATVIWAAPTSSDNCPGETMTSTHNPGDSFLVGTTAVTYTVTDAANNTATCGFNVIVSDTEAPQIICPSSITASNDPGVCDATVTVDPALIVDNCPGASVTNDFNNTADASGTYPIGTTTVVFTVTDAASNSATCSITVTVNDDEDPVIACPTDIFTGVDAGTCGATITYNVPVGTDNCPGAMTTQTLGLGSGVVFPVGVTTEEYTVTDGIGNTASCSFTVEVVDNELPVITACADQTVEPNAAGCEVTTFPGVTFTDNCSATVGYAPNGPFALGAHTITALVTDASGNFATCSFTLTVESTLMADAGPDTDVCLGNSITLDANPSGGSGTYTYDWNDGSGSVGTGQTLTVSPTTTTTYVVTVDDGACTTTDTVTVDVNTLAVDAGPDVDLCAGSSLTLVAVTTGGSGSYTYTWSDGFGTIGTGQSVTVMPTTLVANYTVTVDDGTCVVTDQVMVNVVLSGMTVDAGNDATVCAGTAVTLTATPNNSAGPFTYEWNDGTGIISTSQSITVNPGTTTTYVVSVDDGTCTATDDVVVDVSDLAVSAGADTTICPGGSADLMANVSGGTGSYTFDWSDGTSSVGTTQTLTVNPTATTNYILTVDDGDCVITDTMTVTVYDLTADAGTDTTICTGGMAALNANVAGGSGSYTFDWNDGTGTVATTASFMAMPASTTTYTLTVDDGTCVVTSQVTVSVNDLTADAGNDQTICNGTSATLMATPAGGTGTYTYDWNDGTSSVGTTQTLTVMPTVTTVYTLTVDDGQCTATDVVTVTVVNSTLVVSAGNDTSICPGESLTLNAATSGGSGTYTFSWDDGSTTVGTNQTLAVTPTATTTYTVTVDDGLCSTTSSITVTVEDLTASAGADTTLCSGGSLTLDANPAGGSGTYTFDWNDGTGTVGTSQTLSVTPTTTTTYTLTVDDGTCTIIDDITVTVYDLTVTASNDMNTCPGAPVSLTAIAAGGSGTYTFDWDDGTGSVGTGSTLNASPTTTTTYTVTVDDGTCTSTDQVTVNVNDLNVDAGPDITLCAGSSLTLVAATTGGTGSYTYVWDDGFGNVGTSQTLTINPTTTVTNYTVTVDDGNCVVTDQVTVTVVLSGFTVSAGPDVTICEGSSIDLTAIPNGGSGTFVYDWNDGTGTIGTTQTINVAPTTTTTYVLYADDGVCTSTSQVTVTVVPPFTVAVNNDTTVCSNAAVTLSAMPTGGSGTFTYDWNDGTASVGTTQTLVVNPTATTTYTATVDDGQCVITEQVTVTVYDLSADAGQDVNICEGDTATLMGSGSGGSGSYTFEWFDGATSVGTSATLDVNPMATTTYTLVVDDGVCTDSAQVTITVDNYITNPVACTSCQNGTFEYAPVNANTLIPQYCTDGQWTHYYDPTNPTELLFSIEHTPAGGNTNTFTAEAEIAATVDPTDSLTFNGNQGIWVAQDITLYEANFVMGRHWNVNITSGSLNGFVNVRFYFNPEELNAIAKAADKWYRTYDPISPNPLFVSGPIWFKTQTTTYTPSVAQNPAGPNFPNEYGGSITPVGVVDHTVITNTAFGSTANGRNYVELSNITSFSGGTAAIRVSHFDPVLPVSLLNFDGEKTGDWVTLDWKTVREENIDYYVVERSLDAVNFADLGEVDAAGNSVEQNDYNLIDFDPAIGSNFYRLRIVELDGTVSYSHVVEVVFESGMSFNVYPNPFNDVLNIRLEGITEGSTIFQLTNNLGQIILKETWEIKGEETKTVDVSTLSEGVYFYRIIHEGENVKHGKLTHLN